MGAYAEAFNRDRWRIYKCEERLRVVNLGGTAIGHRLRRAPPVHFPRRRGVREQTGIGFARAENLVEATQNADVFVEVSGILKAWRPRCSRSAPTCAFCRPAPKRGSVRSACRTPGRMSIMPGKINPVIPEAVSQAPCS